MKGKETYAKNIRSLSSLSFSQRGTDLGIGAATGEALADPSSFLYLQRTIAPNPTDQSNSSPGSGPTTPTRSSPVQLKKASSVGAFCGNDSSFTNKTDLSVTYGINSEHKQEQRQSPKDAGPTRRRRQSTSRHDASQHERGEGPLPHQPTPDRRIRTTHQADAMTTGGATNSRRS